MWLLHSPWIGHVLQHPVTQQCINIDLENYCCSCNNKNLSSVVRRHLLTSSTSFYWIRRAWEGASAASLAACKWTCFHPALHGYIKKHKCWLIEKVVLLLVCSSDVWFLLVPLIVCGKVGGGNVSVHCRWNISLSSVRKDRYVSRRGGRPSFTRQGG